MLFYINLQACVYINMYSRHMHSRGLPSLREFYFQHEKQHSSVCVTHNPMQIKQTLLLFLFIPIIIGRRLRVFISEIDRADRNAEGQRSIRNQCYRIYPFSSLSFFSQMYGLQQKTDLRHIITSSAHIMCIDFLSISMGTCWS